MGYWLAPEARGRGIMTDAVRAVVAWAQEHGIRCLTLTAHPENVASHRVAERAGFRRVGLVPHEPPFRDGTTVAEGFELDAHAPTERLVRRVRRDFPDEADDIVERLTNLALPLAEGAEPRADPGRRRPRRPRRPDHARLGHAHGDPRLARRPGRRRPREPRLAGPARPRARTLGAVAQVAQRPLLELHVGEAHHAALAGRRLRDEADLDVAVEREVAGEAPRLAVERGVEDDAEPMRATRSQTAFPSTSDPFASSETPRVTTETTIGSRSGENSKQSLAQRPRRPRASARPRRSSMRRAPARAPRA